MLALCAALLTAACGGGGGGGASSAPDSQAAQADGAPTRTVTLRWSANRERAVNSRGGGYLLYLSPLPGLDAADPRVSVVEVPYVQGAAAPTSANLPLSAGTHYVRIAAYGRALAPGQVPLVSEPGAELVLTVVAP